MAHDVFISHSHKDKPTADAVCTNLEIAGVRCWIAPRDIGPGEDWPDAIARSIPQSRVMVVIFSSSSNASDQVYRELFLAASNNVIIIPFRIEDVEPKPRIGYILAGTHWLDAINPPIQEQIDKLVPCVKSFLSSPEIDKPVRVTPILTPSPTGSPDPKPARRISAWAWRILITVMILIGAAASAYWWRQTSKAVPLTAPIPALINTPEISDTRALGSQAEQASSFADPILTVTAQRKPDFEDDFSQVNAAWKLCDMQGTFAIEEGVARFQVNQGGGCMWNETAMAGKDFVLQLDTDLVSGDTTSWIGILVHQVSSAHSFELKFLPAVQAWNISGKWGNVEPYHTLPSGTNNAVSPVGEVMKLTIIVRGSQFALYLGSTPIAYFDDKNLDNAGITYIHCISVSPAVCEFDNVKFWDLANISSLP